MLRDWRYGWIYTHVLYHIYTYTWPYNTKKASYVIGKGGPSGRRLDEAHGPLDGGGEDGAGRRVGGEVRYVAILLTDIGGERAVSDTEKSALLSSTPACFKMGATLCS
jgi:hypothetical protein